MSHEHNTISFSPLGMHRHRKKNFFSFAFSRSLSLPKPKKIDKTHTLPRSLPLRWKYKGDKPYRHPRAAAQWPPDHLNPVPWLDKGSSPPPFPPYKYQGREMSKRGAEIERKKRGKAWKIEKNERNKGESLEKRERFLKKK
jgi:hypothetical protein